MAQTTLTTLATVVPTELIVDQIIAEARPFNVVAPLVQRGTLGQGEGVVLSFPMLPSTSAASVAEASDITAGARTTLQYSITCAEVGLSTEVTDIAARAAKVAGDVLTWAGSQGRAIAQKLTGDLCALFAALNGSTAVGSTGTAITVANFIEAIYTLDNANAPGQKVSVLHPRQVADLFAAIVAAAGTVYHNLPELIREGRLPGGTPSAGFMGELFGVPIYSTTEVDAVNSSADRAGAMFTKEAMGVGWMWGIRAAYDRDESKRSTEIVVTACYGVGEIVDAYGVPIETDA